MIIDEYLISGDVGICVTADACVDSLPTPPTPNYFKSKKHNYSTLTPTK
jgi:hypothetical protein